MLSITLFLLLSFSTFQVSAGNTKQHNVNMKTSTLEPESATVEASKDVFIFKGIKLKKYEETINIGIPWTRLNSKFEAAIKIINDEIKKLNNMNRTEYKNFLLSTSCSRKCHNTGVCFKAGKTEKCACRQKPVISKGTEMLKVYDHNTNCENSQLMTIDVNQRSAVSAREGPTDYYHLDEIVKGIVSLIYNQE
jgi:hypothetical protein